MFYSVVMEVEEVIKKHVEELVEYLVDDKLGALRSALDVHFSSVFVLFTKQTAHK